MRKILLFVTVLITFSVEAQELPKNYTSLLKEVEPSLITWRRHFHEFPELSNREVNTGVIVGERPPAQRPE